MIRSLLLVAVALGCSNGSTGAPAGEPLLKLKLTSKDPHLVDVARVELQLRRDNVFFREQVSGPAGQPLALPVEVIVKIPIAAGALDIDATVRGRAGEVVGDGVGQAVVPGEASLELYSLRTDRPSRIRPGVADAAPELDAAVDAAAPADAEAPADVGREAAPPDAASCTNKSYRLVASAVVGVDYGSRPRDGVDSRVTVSSGFGHGHVHDYVGWMRFDLPPLQATAELVSLRVVLELDTLSSPPPPLAILYSASDSWNPAVVTSETAETIMRGGRVSGELGFPVAGRASYAVDVARYRALWPADLRDMALTLGMISTSAADAPETWAYFHGLTGRTPPALDVTTCE